MKNRNWISLFLIGSLTFFSNSVGFFIPSKAAINIQTNPNPVPLLAYYYIWFNASSWDRAKTDYPLLGHYSSDDENVMLQHIRWAKNAGIDGFIVSWKSTDVLNRRLDLLVQLANQENFKLVVIYEGLDFSREPLPVDQVAEDLVYFKGHFAGNPVFSLFSKPVMIWSGTWMFSPEEIAQVGQQIRSSILLLASEKNLAGYERLTGLVDGNAYYWSSVNPETNTNYVHKLAEMAQTVHQANGLWFAPAAPGFDGRLVGGTTVVERKNGDTLRTEFNTAMNSSPDAIGIISWNEFSENSHIEPSENYGDQYLKILKEINQATPPAVGAFDSSEPAATYPQVIPEARVIALAGFGILILSALIYIARRH